MGCNGKRGIENGQKKGGLKISYYHNNPADTTSISNNNIYDITSDEKIIFG